METETLLIYQSTLSGMSVSPNRFCILTYRLIANSDACDLKNMHARQSKAGSFSIFAAKCAFNTGLAGVARLVVTDDLL